MALRVQTLARELALKALYQHDLLGGRSPEELRAFCTQNGGPEVAEPAIELVEGCIGHGEKLDEVIRRTAENWELKRMATSDRNILRLGVFELLFRQQTPPKVAINEAIELAKKYSTANSPPFINGVLDRIYNVHVVGGAEEEAGPLPEADDSPGAAGKGRAAGVTARPDPQARADLHVHSTASDGSHEPSELPAMAAKAGVAALALTDHDSVEGVAAAGEAAAAVGVELVPGVELTGYAPRADGTGEMEVHIAGLFVDATSPVLLGRLRDLRAARVERIRQMSRKLGELGMAMDSEDVLRRADGGSVGRVHFAQQMVAQGYCRDLSEAFQRYIGADCPAYVAKEKMTPAQAIALVQAAGGCSALCHPALLPDFESYLEELVEQGLDALEVHCPVHTPQDERRLLEMARRFALAVTGGSDFHGAAKPEIRIGQETVSFVELDRLKQRARQRI